MPFAHEQEGQAWAKLMIDLLESILKDVYSQGGALPEDQAAHYREQYRAILTQAEIECPPPTERQETDRKKGRIKRSKSRNRVAVKIMFRPTMRLPCFLRVDCLTLFLNWID